jgi:HD-GYP domain-containing protein (c-di-GMP phosphodiesterase class II)
LVAERIGAVAQAVAAALRGDGWRVDIAVDLPSALSRCRQLPPGLVVIGSGMTSPEGRSLADLLDAGQETPSLPRVHLLPDGPTAAWAETSNESAVPWSPQSPEALLVAVRNRAHHRQTAPNLGDLWAHLPAEPPPPPDRAPQPPQPAPETSEAPAAPGGACPPPLAEMVDTVGELLAAMGLNVVFLDDRGDPVLPPAPANPLCRAYQKDGPDQPIRCLGELRTLAGEVLSTHQARFARGEQGCLLLGSPLRAGKLFHGVVAASCPTTDMASPERIARFAAGEQLSPEQADRAVRLACRHDPAEAPDLLKLLSRLVDMQREATAAQGRLSAMGSNLASTYEELSLVYRISGAMNVKHSGDEFLRMVCSELLDVMDVESAAVVQFADEPGCDHAVVLTGSAELCAEQVRLLTDMLTATELRDDCPIAVNNDPHLDPASGLAGAVRNYVASSLDTGPDRLGVLLAINKRDGRFHTVDTQLLTSLANQAAVFLDNQLLYSDLQDLLMGVLHSLTAAIDAKDTYTRGHSERVAQVSRVIARQIGLGEHEIQRAYLAGLLHDIGKIGVPEAILCNPNRLSESEFDVIRQHPDTGARILGDIRQLRDVTVAMLTHHERMDGTGYPRGLSGRDVPIIGRIVGLADCFDAMTSSRTYREALPVEAVKAEIRRCAGTQFDPDLVETFLSINLERLLEWLYDPRALAMRQKLPAETLLRPQERLLRPAIPASA